MRHDQTFNGIQDAYVMELNQTGSALEYATYLGGSAGDSGAGIAVDSQGNAHCRRDDQLFEFPDHAGGGRQRVSSGGSVS